LPVAAAYASVLAGLVAAVLGTAVGFAVYCWPTLAGKPDYYLAWGWFGWLPAIVVGFWVGRLANHWVTSKLRDK
jgi:hypothetical protein